MKINRTRASLDSGARLRPPMVPAGHFHARIAKCLLVVDFSKEYERVIRQLLGERYPLEDGLVVGACLEGVSNCVKSVSSTREVWGWLQTTHLKLKKGFTSHKHVLPLLDGAGVPALAQRELL